MTEKSDDKSGGLPKTFDPAEIEARWYAHWENEGLFRPERPDAEPFTIVNPPPNVTGSLHIGHALDNTLQDVMIRYERLRGKDALWVVGTDHAGIATQMVVERQMEAQGDSRAKYSREEFVDKVWEWKEESGGTITRQLRRLGCSMDWSREQFTMDPHFTHAVVKVFVDLYNDGLIYRDKRLVNWDPKLKTAISDLEVETREVQGHFWHFRYPLANGARTADGKDHIVVATTRPETMLADMVVAVHPTDERYKALVEAGAKVVLPITGREIPVVADEHADPELGSGAVKITPGHDFNDFEVGKRAGIAAGDMLNMFDAEAKVVQTADGLIPDEYVGMDRFDARKAVVAALKASGHLVLFTDRDGNEKEAEDRVIQTPYGDRGGVVIEPWLTDQWYVDAKTLAAPAIEAVKSGAIEIVPKSWEKTWFNWLGNIQPWCVSRQLWWGHRIPAWYGPGLHEDGDLITGDTIRVDADFRETGRKPTALKVFVAETEEEALSQARSFYPAHFKIELGDDPTDRGQKLRDTAVLHRDPDVLDTWFSSALWPFATLGWPEDLSPQAGEGLLAKHYPNDLLISGFDILFFWDARMAMQGIKQMGEVPWKRLYLHGLVRAADGQKMSKSKGNVVDPLGLIDKYGADALRFFMAAMESQGRDIKMDDGRVEGYRNFATKLWNAARFAQSNGIGASSDIAAPTATLAVNRWIIGEVGECQRAIDKALADLRFDAAADTIYHFVWDRFCDWYLELIKPLLGEGGKAPEADETRAVAGWALDQILVMLHPFMPFITEELWSKLGERDNYPLITARWPAPEAGVDAEAKAEIEWLIGFTSALRSARSEIGIPPGARTDVIVHNDRHFDGAVVQEGVRLDWVEHFKRNGSALSRLARIDVVQFAMTGTALDLRNGSNVDRTTYESGKTAAFQIVFDDTTYSIPLEGVIDINAEKARLAKALQAVEKERDSLDKRLSNPSFVEKAKPEAVEKARDDHAAKSAEAERLSAALARLG